SVIRAAAVKTRNFMICPRMRVIGGIFTRSGSRFLCLLSNKAVIDACHSGAEPTGPARSGRPDERLREEPGIHNPSIGDMDSGLAALRRSGMTKRMTDRELSRRSVAVFFGVGVVAIVLRKPLDRRHLLTLGGREDDDALGRAAGDANAVHRTA